MNNDWGSVPAGQTVQSDSANPPKPNDGGPAFPVETFHDKGMTLRDWFAGMALSGLASEQLGRVLEAKPRTVSLFVATWAYELADAMLAERSKT